MQAATQTGATAVAERRFCKYPTGKYPTGKSKFFCRLHTHLVFGKPVFGLWYLGGLLAV
jgi:hypothetical protein